MNITDRDIIKLLQKTSMEKPRPDEVRKDSIIATVLEAELPIRKGSSFAEFFLAQFGFINKNVIFWQLTWLVLFLYAVQSGSVFQLSNSLLCILSMSPPLLVLLLTDEISHIYSRSMLEIEYAAKYSIKKVILSRMLILSIMNGIFILIGIAYANRRIDLPLLDTLIYSLTPLLSMTAVLLILMKKFKGVQLIYSGISVYILQVLLIVAGQTEYIDIYSRDYLKMWLLLLLTSAVLIAYNLQRLCRILDNFEILAE